MTTLLIILAAAAMIFWFVQLLSLMRMSDEQFPGRFDKPIWAAILLVLSVLGALLFVIWKRSVRADQESEVVASQLAGMIRRSEADSDAT